MNFNVFILDKYKPHDTLKLNPLLLSLSVIESLNFSIQKDLFNQKGQSDGRHRQIIWHKPIP